MALGQFVEGSVVVVPFLSGNAVFEPAKSQTARADHAPVEVRARQCPGVKDQVASGDGQFRHDAVRCGAEHGTGPGDVDGVARFQDAAAHHGFHRITGTGADGNACGKACFHSVFFTEMTDDVPRLYDARHEVFGNAQNIELFLGPFFLTTS